MCETWVPVILSGTGMLNSIQLRVKDHWLYSTTHDWGHRIQQIERRSSKELYKMEAFYRQEGAG